MVLTYANLKNLILSKDLLWQYQEEDTSYNIFVVENGIIYSTILPKDGYDPIGINFASERLDFLTNYQSTANQRVENSVKFNEPQLVGIKKLNIGPRSWIFSHNFCNRTTWFGDAIKVVGEAVGLGDGAATAFNLLHGNVIDVVHGNITDEDYLVPFWWQGGSSYKLVIRVDGVVKVEQEFGNSGGDYVVNYVTGVITFVNPVTSGLAIIADYFYENGSTLYIVPKAGKRTIITFTECQFSSDIVMNDVMISALYTYNPYLGLPPLKFEYPGSRCSFKRFSDYINYTMGSFPIIPAIGGGVRGNIKDILQLRFDYTSSIELASAYGSELRVWLKSNLVYGGEIATITFYGYEENE